MLGAGVLHKDVGSLLFPGNKDFIAGTWLGKRLRLYNSTRVCHYISGNAWFLPFSFWYAAITSMYLPLMPMALASTGDQKAGRHIHSLLETACSAAFSVRKWFQTNTSQHLLSRGMDSKLDYPSDSNHVCISSLITLLPMKRSDGNESW